MIDKAELKTKIEQEEDFIYCPREGNSLKNFLAAHSDGVDNAKIAKVLLMTEEEVEAAFQSALGKFKEGLGENNG